MICAKSQSHPLIYANTLTSTHPREFKVVFGFIAFD